MARRGRGKKLAIGRVIARIIPSGFCSLGENLAYWHNTTNRTILCERLRLSSLGLHSKDILKVEQNISRLEYLLSLYHMTVEEVLRLASDGLKNPLTRDDIFASEISIQHLKRIDAIFNKGLHFYVDPEPLSASKDASIFFRKNTFGAKLSLGAKQIVRQFEEKTISLTAISKLAEIRLERTLPVVSVQDSPKSIALEMRAMLYPAFTPDLKEFLRALIAKLADQNVLVYEFVEAWNKKERANIDGFFLSPNVIVLKRHQNAFRREIFTLAHEFGHYLLNEEEIEELDVANLSNTQLSATEKWCNDFAYYFLAGEFDAAIERIINANPANDYHFDVIKEISEQTHLSQIALFTRLLFLGKMSLNSYRHVQAGFEEDYKHREAERRLQKELDKQHGVQTRGSAPKPIISPLLITTVQAAYYEGVISEYDACKTLNVSADRLGEYLP